MAHWMKYWPAFVAAGCGLVSLWLLPPDPPRRARNLIPPTDAQVRSLRLMREARRLNEVLKRARWVAAIGRTLEDEAEGDDHEVPLAFPPAIDESTRARFRTQVRSEIERLDIEEPRYGFAAAQPEGLSGNHAMFRRESTTSPEYYTLDLGGRPTCLTLKGYQADPTHYFWQWGWSPRPGNSNILGPCAFYLIHGRPGPAIETWLKSGAAQFAMRHAESRNPFDELPNREALRFRPGSQGIFGMRYSESLAPAHRCLAGVREACRQAALVPQESLPGARRDVPEFLHRDFPEGPFYTFAEGPFYTMEESLFYDLEQEFGRDAFGRFWTSDQDVETAFQAAFGLPIGDWVMRWGQERFGVYHMGPLPTFEAFFLSLVTISFFLTIAIAMGKRRRVG